MSGAVTTVVSSVVSGPVVAVPELVPEVVLVDDVELVELEVGALPVDGAVATGADGAG